MRLPSCASSLRLRLLYAQPPPLLCGRASASQRSLVASLPPPQTPEKRRRLLVLLQLSSGVKATGGRAESEGVAHVFDFPTRARCVDVHAIVSDAVKGSHVQRGPLSMGAQSEPGQRSPKVKKGEIVLAHSVGDATAQVGSLLGGRFLRRKYNGYLRVSPTVGNYPLRGVPLKKPRETQVSAA